MQSYSVTSEVGGKYLTQPPWSFFRKGGNNRSQQGIKSQSIYLQSPCKCCSSNQRCESTWKITRRWAIAHRFVKSRLFQVIGSCKEQQWMPQLHRSQRLTAHLPRTSELGLAKSSVQHRCVLSGRLCSWVCSAGHQSWASYWWWWVLLMPLPETRTLETTLINWCSLKTGGNRRGTSSPLGIPQLDEQWEEARQPFCTAPGAARGKTPLKCPAPPGRASAPTRYTNSHQK